MIRLAKAPKRRTLAQAREDAERVIRGEVVSAKSTKRDGTRRVRPRFIEDDHQKALFDWAEKSEGAHPALRLLYAVPNGGRRDPREAARLKLQGVKPGVPDIHLPVTRAHTSLRIELKRPIVKGEAKPVVSDDQARWLYDLQREGDCCCVCYGWDQAREAIEAYLAMRTVPHQWVAP